MGKLRQLRAKALSLRGALAIGGSIVVAASMTQVAGTLAAPDAVRTASWATSSQNYFPTPLPDKAAPGFNNVGINCESTYVFPANVAQISWPSVGTGYRYKIVQQRVNSNGAVTWSEVRWTNKTTENFNYSVTATTTQIRVYVVNAESGDNDSSRVVSSGFVGVNIYTPTASNTRCTNPVDYYRTDNAAWENQRAWMPGSASFAAGPGVSMFTTLIDTLNSDEVLEPLPEDTVLADLDAVARPEPAPTTEPKPTEPEASTPVSAPTSPSAEAGPETEGESTETSASSSTSTAPSTRVTPTSGTTKPAPTSTTPQTVPTPTSTTVRTTTPTATTVRAGVGDDPIAVGTAFARLEDADGQAQLVVTNASGGQVCTADVPGATQISSAGGKLTVTVDGRTRGVDPATCEIN